MQFIAAFYDERCAVQMADFRSIHCSIWDDEWFNGLILPNSKTKQCPDGIPDHEFRLFWVYLITNIRTKGSGLYILPANIVSAESLVNPKRLPYFWQRLQDDKKAFREGNLVWVKKMRHYQSNGSPKFWKGVEKDVSQIPDGNLKSLYIAYQLDGNSLSIANQSISDDNDNDNNNNNDNEGAAAKPIAPKKLSSPVYEISDTDWKPVWEVLQSCHGWSEPEAKARAKVAFAKANFQHLDLVKVAQNMRYWLEKPVNGAKHGSISRFMNFISNAETFRLKDLDSNPTVNSPPPEKTKEAKERERTRLIIKNRIAQGTWDIETPDWQEMMLKEAGWKDVSEAT